MGTMKPKVIVCMLAYNHGKFISEAIESVFEQKADFNYKILICNDASTDNTKDIIEKYRDIYGDKIIAVHNKKNLGITNNAKKLYSLAIESGAEYIATLEGDDYWMDANKLQLQVDRMDNNLDLVLTCGNFLEYDDESDKFSASQIEVLKTNTWEKLDDKSILINWRTKYLTYLIRTNELKKTKFLKYRYLLDYHLVYDLNKLGSLELYKGIFGVYRRHINGNFGKEFDLVKIKIELKIYKSLLKLNPGDEFLWMKYIKTAKSIGKVEFFKSRVEDKLKRIIFL